MATTVCATRSAIVGTPSTRTPAPCGLGISTALTGGGKYEARAHPVPDLVEIVRKIGLECLEILPVHPGCALVGLDPPPRLPDHRLGDRKRLVVGLWHCSLASSRDHGLGCSIGHSGSAGPLAPPPPQQAAASRLLRAGPPASAASLLSASGFGPLAGSLSQP